MSHFLFFFFFRSFDDSPNRESSFAARKKRYYYLAPLLYQTIFFRWSPRVRAGLCFEKRENRLIGFIFERKRNMLRVPFSFLQKKHHLKNYTAYSGKSGGDRSVSCIKTSRFGFNSPISYLGIGGGWSTKTPAAAANDKPVGY